MKKVFVGGCDRSGTTLLASMLGCFETAIVTPESQFKLGLLAGKMRPSRKRDLWRLKLWGITERQLVELESRSASEAELLERLVFRYADQKGVKPDVWIDHTPNNMYSVPILEGHFDDASYVHIIRDGRAIAASILPLDWGPNSSRQAAGWWVQKVGYGLAARIKIPRKVITVHFEDLIRNPLYELERLCDFLKLDFSQEMLNGSAFNVPAYTKKQHELVGQKPDRSRVSAWRKKLTPREIEIFEYMAGPMLKLLGYSCDFAMPESPSRRERFELRLRESLFLNQKKMIRRKINIMRAKLE